VDDRNTIVVIDNSDLHRLGIGRRPDEHRDVWVISLERSPVVSECMQHVVIRDTVLAGARLDVHELSLRSELTVVNIC
jgi:hypothetical protein